MKLLQRLLFAVVICSVLGQAKAQITIGGAANVITSNWAQDYNDTKTRLSFSAGLAGQYDITERLGVGAELLLASIGPRIESSNGNKGSFKATALQLPLFASYEVIDKLRVHAGFEPMFILSAKFKIKEGPNEGEYDENDDYKSSGIDFILGASYDITENISALLRLDLGLSNLAEDHEDPGKPIGVVIGARYWFWRSK